MEKITLFLKSVGAEPCKEWREKIAKWRAWYHGHFSDFHDYRIFNGTKNIAHKRLSLGMAKKACEDWANLLLNERVLLATDNEAFNKGGLKETLAANSFWARGNQLIEKAFALGTGALVEFTDASGAVIIDFIEADKIFPISVVNGEITECAFATERRECGKKQYYVQIHKTDEVLNYLLNKEGKEIPLPDGVAAAYPTDKVKRFQILKPNVVNNHDFNQPLGLSVFANAIDQIQGVDTIYDSLINDYKIGRSRVLVPLKYSTIAQMSDGVKKPVFDVNDTVFHVIPSQDDGSKIEFIQPTIRSADHIAGLNTALSLFADKCGLGPDRYKYERGSVQTATQVISEKSELYQNVTKHELVLNDALVGMVKAIAHLLGADVKEVTATFDDSIIQDKDAKKAAFINEINAGIRQAWEYRVEFLAETPAQAQANTGEIKEPPTEDDPDKAAA